MPKSKREKVVALTRTDKKGRERKDQLFQSIREALDTYKYAWVFSVENMRNTYLKDVRAQWSDSRIFLGRTKVMAKALGASASEEYQDNLHELTRMLKGTVGLLCTSHPEDVVRDWFAEYSKTDFARAGMTSPSTITIPSGVLYSRAGQVATEDDVPISHTLEPSIRAMGVPSRLTNGTVMLSNEYTICKEGDVLNSNQTKLLKLFGIPLATFEVVLLGYYDKEQSKVISQKIVK